MDIDRYILEHQGDWDRLAELTARARRDPGRLLPVELDELVRRYQLVSAQLSFVRTTFRDQALVIRLTALVADAGSVVYGRRRASLAVIAEFFTRTFPAAVFRSGRTIAASAALLLVPAVGVALWMLNVPDALEASGTREERITYVEEQFEQYYSESPAPQFATEVTVNNIRVSFLAFALGGAGCVLGGLVLAVNGVGVGQAAAWMISEGDSLRFWGLILPHGALEITAIVIAGAAGLQLGWAVLVPGDRSRARAAVEEGRRSAVIVLGLMVCFVLAGLIEGFVTGRGLPAGLRVGIGLVVEAAFITYVVVVGRRAVDDGYSGSLGERPADRPARPHSRAEAFTAR